MKWYCLWVHIIMSLVHYHAGFSVHLVGNNSINNHHLCHKQEGLWLLQLKQSLLSPPQQLDLHFMCDGPSNYSKLMSWNQRRRDCCSWDGVTCDHSTGHVVGLDLSCSSLEGTIESNSTIFSLTHLRSLNLAYNYLEAESFKFGELTNLTYLNLSALEFSGDIPVEFYRLSNLTWLDISGVGVEGMRYSSSTIKLDIKTLLGNMSELRVVLLRGVNISSELPINISSSSLTRLDLEMTGLGGDLPASVFEIPALQILNLRYNSDLTGCLPSLNRSSIRLMEQLDLSETNVSGRLPDSVGFMTNLKSMDLSFCKFSGSIPDSIGNLTQITEMYLQGNKLSGKVPSTITNLRHLTLLYLFDNHLQGQLPDAFSHLQKLTEVRLSENGFTGVIPSSLTNISLLQSLEISSNALTGRIPWSLFNMSNLEKLDLSSNKLTGALPFGASQGLQKLSDIRLSGNSIQGTVPSWLLTLPSLQLLYLSSNRISGEIDKFNSQSLTHLDLSNNQLNIQLDSFHNLTSLQTLFLSHNTITKHGVVNLTLPSLYRLELSNCEIKEFPNLSTNLSSLGWLDLSNNKFQGPIPSWFTSSPWAHDLVFLNISMNYLTDATNLPWHQLQSLRYLDLHSNSLQDTIPSSICNMTDLSILNLSNNKFRGTIPECVGTFLENLWVLDLKENELQGKIPASFIGGEFCQLVSLGLNNNHLEGPLPPSLVNYTDLEVLDVGNNMIRDTFPLWLGNLTSLKVLILKSNNFHGRLVSNNSLSDLQVIDLSDNNFTGILPDDFFARLEAMKRQGEDATSLSYLGSGGYDFSVTVTVKGVEVLTKVLRIFTTIDLSRNNFHGHIPEAITDLSFLRLLNLSHNNINGTIPGALGCMTKLEHLDLSSNQLTGGIPPTLTRLTFIAVLNLSQNHLVGQIPMGNQFETFSNDSYIGNSGLCGFPLTKSCGDGTAPGGMYDEEEEEDSGIMAGFTWKAVVMGYGCGIVLGFVLGYVIVSIGKPECVARFVYVEAAIILKRRKKKRTRMILHGGR